MYKLRKKPFMQRILAPFTFKHETDEEEPQQPAGPYHNLEKSAAVDIAAGGSGGATHAQPNMAEGTLVSAAAVNTMRANGPNSSGPRAAAAGAANNSDNRQGQRDTSTSIPRKPVNQQSLTVNTRNLTPATNPSPLGISPISPPPSYSHQGRTPGGTVVPAAEVSPITTSPVSQRSSLRASPFYTLSPPPVSAPPEPGTAIKIAGSEARIVRIPPRSSRATMSSVSSGSRPGSSAGAESNNSNNNNSHHYHHTAATTNNYSNKFINSYHQQPAATAMVLPLYARPPPADARYQNRYPNPGHNNGMGGSYRPYHPSVGEIVRKRSQRNRAQQQQQQLQLQQHILQQQQQESVGNRASIASEASIASSDVMPPDAIAWPMPPRTPTTSPDPH